MMSRALTKSLAEDTNIEVWSQVEVGTAIVAACLPTLAPLAAGHDLRSIFGSLRSRLSLRSNIRSQTTQIDSDGQTLTAMTSKTSTSLRNKASVQHEIGRGYHDEEIFQIPSNSIMMRTGIQQDTEPVEMGQY